MTMYWPLLSYCIRPSTSMHSVSTQQVEGTITHFIWIPTPSYQSWATCCWNVHYIWLYIFLYMSTLKRSMNGLSFFIHKTKDHSSLWYKIKLYDKRKTNILKFRITFYYNRLQVPHSVKNTLYSCIFLIFL